MPDLGSTEALEECLETVAICYQAGDLKMMTEACKAGLQSFQDNYELLMFLGIARGESGEFEEAIEILDKSIERFESNFQAHFNRAVYLVRLGEADEARESLVRCVQLKPKFGQAWYSLVNSRKVNPGNPIIDRMKRVLKKKLPTKDASLINFAIARAYDDIGEYDRSWYHLNMANGLYPIAPLDVEQLLKNTSETTFNWTPQLVESLKSGQTTKAPIFVVGMPRSGTTLMEQILDRHALVEGQGELGMVNHFVDSFSQLTDTPYPGCVSEMSSEVMSQYADIYLSHLPQTDEFEYFVDKNPLNFQHLGLIMSMFPNAKIVNMIRNPMDVILSCYQQPFASGQAFSFDLERCAVFYRYYEVMMTHWRKLFSESVIDVNYDYLVKHPRVVISDTLSALGLEPDEACFQHHEFKGKISTASVLQANQPVYTGASGKWVNYRKYLAPAKKILRT